MTQYKIIKKTASGGNLYAIPGCIPFINIDLSKMEWGDAIRDNNGNGTFKSVNVCDNCGLKYLNSTLIFVPEYGPCCQKGYYGP